MAQKRVLIISHNCLNRNTNMGLTLKSFFSAWDPDKLVQIYFVNDTPDFENSSLYYRITDKDVFHSLFKPGEHGQIIEQSEDAKNPTQVGLITKLARNRTPLVYFTRNLLWKIGKWRTEKLNRFIDDFDPELIYFASGDYAFSYQIALKIAKDRNVPLIIGCFDDFYFQRRKTIRPLYHLNRRYFMKTVKETFDYACGFTAICDLMQRDYQQYFHKSGITLCKTSGLKKCENYRATGNIVYAGNLDLGRAEQLVSLGMALKEKGLPYLHVYSGETRKKYIKPMSEKSGIVFHGYVPSEKLSEILSQASFLVHTESFKEKYIQRVKYSVSTKISDYLASGIPIIAYGSEQVASIQYLKDNHAAYCFCSENELKEKIHLLFSENDSHNCVLQNAASLSNKNHSSDNNYNKLDKLIHYENYSDQ